MITPFILAQERKFEKALSLAKELNYDCERSAPRDPEFAVIHEYVSKPKTPKEQVESISRYFQRLYPVLAPKYDAVTRTDNTTPSIRNTPLESLDGQSYESASSPPFLQNMQVSTSETANGPQSPISGLSGSSDPRWPSRSFMSECSWSSQSSRCSPDLGFPSPNLTIDNDLSCSAHQSVFQVGQDRVHDVVRADRSLIVDRISSTFRAEHLAFAIPPQPSFDALSLGDIVSKEIIPSRNLSPPLFQSFTTMRIDAAMERDSYDASYPIKSTRKRPRALARKAELEADLLKAREQVDSLHVQIACGDVLNELCACPNQREELALRKRLLPESTNKLGSHYRRLRTLGGLPPSSATMQLDYSGLTKHLKEIARRIILNSGHDSMPSPVEHLQLGSASESIWTLARDSPEDVRQLKSAALTAYKAARCRIRLHESLNAISRDTKIPTSVRRKRCLERVVDPRSILLPWLRANSHRPYPTKEQKIELSKQTGLTIREVARWFVRARCRIRRGLFFLTPASDRVGNLDIAKDLVSIELLPLVTTLDVCMTEAEVDDGLGDEIFMDSGADQMEGEISYERLLTS